MMKMCLLPWERVLISLDNKLRQRILIIQGSGPFESEITF